MRKYTWSVVLLLAGCQVGNGVPASEERSVSSFEALYNEGSLGVVAIIDPSLDGPEVRVECDENLIDRLRTEVSDDVLRVFVAMGPSIAPKTRCEVTVAVPALRVAKQLGSGGIAIDGVNPITSLTRLVVEGSGDLRVDAPVEGDFSLVRVEGSGNVRMDAVTTTELTVDVMGSGDVQIDAGEVQRLGLTSSGSGNVDLRGLVAQDATVYVEGSGDSIVHCRDRLDVALLGSGNVTVLGDPEHRDEHISGSGNVAYQ